MRRCGRFQAWQNLEEKERGSALVTIATLVRTCISADSCTSAVFTGYFGKRKIIKLVQIQRMLQRNLVASTFCQEQTTWPPQLSPSQQQREAAFSWNRRSQATYSRPLI